jgi:hypothetical protein
MGFLADIPKLSSRYILFCFMLAVLISSGYILIYFYSINLFLKLDVFKLLILSFAFSMGLLIFNTLIVTDIINPPKNSSPEGAYFILFIITGSLTLMQEYIVILMKALFNNSGKWAIVTVLIFQLIIITCFSILPGKKFLKRYNL